MGYRMMHRVSARYLETAVNWHFMRFLKTAGLRPFIRFLKTASHRISPYRGHSQFHRGI